MFNLETMINTKTKNKSDDFITKDYFNKTLKKVLKNYPTKDDLKIALLPYAKKSDLDNLERKFDEVYLNTRNDMMQFKDDIISMFLDLKTEIISMKALYNRHDEKIDTHEIRITNLESAKT